MELWVRETIQGIRTGLHPSRRKGVSPDFVQHRGYRPGDPIRFLDWKVYARTREHYIRQFEEESSMDLWLVVDGSGSMEPDPETVLTDRGERELPPKYSFACRIGALLAGVVLNQRDRVGLAIAGERGRLVKPASTQNHLSRMLRELIAHDAGGDPTPEEALRLVEETASGPGMVVLVSDLMFDADPVQRRLKNLRARGHDVLLFMITTPAETALDFNRWVEFEDAEAAAVHHRIDTTHLQAVYREEVEAHRERWNDFCRKQHIDLVRVGIQEDLVERMHEYLIMRQTER